MFLLYYGSRNNMIDFFAVGIYRLIDRRCSVYKVAYEMTYRSIGFQKRVKYELKSISQNTVEMLNEEIKKSPKIAHSLIILIVERMCLIELQRSFAFLQSKSDLTEREFPGRGFPGRGFPGPCDSRVEFYIADVFEGRFCECKFYLFIYFLHSTKHSTKIIFTNL